MNRSSFVCSFVRSIVHAFLRSFVRSFVRVFDRWFVRFLVSKLCSWGALLIIFVARRAPEATFWWLGGLPKRLFGGPGRPRGAQGPSGRNFMKNCISKGFREHPKCGQSIVNSGVKAMFEKILEKSHVASTLYLLCFRPKTWFAGPPFDLPTGPKIEEKRCYMEERLQDRFSEGAGKATRREAQRSTCRNHNKYCGFR